MIIHSKEIVASVTPGVNKLGNTVLGNIELALALGTVGITAVNRKREWLLALAVVLGDRASNSIKTEIKRVPTMAGNIRGEVSSRRRGIALAALGVGLTGVVLAGATCVTNNAGGEQGLQERVSQFVYMVNR